MRVAMIDPSGQLPGPSRPVVIVTGGSGLLDSRLVQRAHTEHDDRDGWYGRNDLRPPRRMRP
jgi:hypothetical protein